MAKEYWQCTVGPVESEKIHERSNDQFRSAIDYAFRDTLHIRPETSVSSWCPVEEEEDVAPVRDLHYRRRNNMSAVDQGLSIAQLHVERVMASEEFTGDEKMYVADEIVTLLKALRSMT